MAEGDKELAREEAFKKYNAAITAAGVLASKEQYSERVQIQLTEIARLASQSNTTNALKTQILLREQAEISMIDRVAAAQKLADEARLKALKEYLNLLNGGGGGSGGLTSGAPSMPKSLIPIKGAGGVRGPKTFSNEELQYFEDLNESMYGDLFANGKNPFETSSNSGGNAGGSTKIDLTINTGVGDPEAIARAIEDLLNQSGYRGTSTNRGSGVYITP